MTNAEYITVPIRLLITARSIEGKLVLCQEVIRDEEAMAALRGMLPGDKESAE